MEQWRTVGYSVSRCPVQWHTVGYSEGQSPLQWRTVVYSGSQQGCKVAYSGALLVSKNVLYGQ